jgi:hypothetical protein
MCLDMVDQKRDPNNPVTITDGTGIDIVPVFAIPRIRLDDPEVEADRRPFGFASPDA